MRIRMMINDTPLFVLAKAMPKFLGEYLALKRQASREDALAFPFGPFYPCLMDRDEESGTALGHYFHQDLLIAQRIFQNNPVKHVDIGSRIDGFVSHIASFRKIEVFDIRPLDRNIRNIDFRQADFQNTKYPFEDYCDSISCLHALEHFGLGRYGDMINFKGHLTGLDNIRHMLKSKGKCYISVPIGKQRIEFNAHRVFSMDYLLNLLQGTFHIDMFSYVNDKGLLTENVDLSNDAVRENFGCVYGCGIFELTKIR